MRELFLLVVLATSVAGYEPFRSLKAPAEIIKQYEIVSPLITHQSEPQPHPQELTVRIVSQATTFTLNLELNKGLLAPHFTSTYYDEYDREIFQKGHVNCFYHGRVLGHPEWTATMSTCHGLQGSFGDLGDKDHYYHLEPLNRLDTSLHQPHALYLGSELRHREGTCGTSHHGNNTMLPPVIDRQAAKERLRRQSNNQLLIVEWVTVSDNSQFREYNQNITATVLRALNVANFVDMLYRVLNVRVVLVNAITWTNGDRISVVTDSSVLLDNFQAYSPQITVPHDSAMLLTGIDLEGNTVGIAFTRAMCSDSNSVGVTQDGGASLDQVSSTAAHELGHIFNMDHDSPPTRTCSCSDPSGNCIMAAISGGRAPTQWSDCSRSDLQEGLTIFNLGRCLTNEPTMTVGDPVCGNGIRERDEVCDCGSPQECRDPCCNATTCTLARGAQCFTGPCCSNCQFVDYGTTCRGATNECDIMEYCSGNSSECPDDVHRQDGSICNTNQSFCFSGFCRSRDDQCQTHFGSVSAVEACYSEYNTQGTQFGNCGYTSTSFLRCASGDVLCGQLHCAGGSFMNNVGVRSGITVITARTPSGAPCRSFTTRPGADIMSPGLVQDGTRCGDGMLCYMRRCTPVNQLSYLQACSTNNGQTCSGNGQCNNRNQCSCNVNFVGDACQTVRPTSNGGAIAGAVIGVLLGLLLIAGGVVGVVFLVLKKKKKPLYSPARRTVAGIPSSRSIRKPLTDSQDNLLNPEAASTPQGARRPPPPPSQGYNPPPYTSQPGYNPPPYTSQPGYNPPPYIPRSTPQPATATVVTVSRKAPPKPPHSQPPSSSRLPPSRPPPSRPSPSQPTRPAPPSRKPPEAPPKPSAPPKLPKWPPSDSETERPVPGPPKKPVVPPRK